MLRYVNLFNAFYGAIQSGMYSIFVDILFENKFPG